MQQVPYAIIGDGRMARHFSYYLQLLQIPFVQWSRRVSVKPDDSIKASACVLLLISDDAIEAFIRDNPLLHAKKVIHFSGKLTTSYAYSAHPLVTFGSTLYPLEVYQKIPFILEQGRAEFTELFPQLPNPHYAIPAAKKALYHSLFVLSGNFTVLLWQKFFKELHQQFAIPA